MSKEYGVTVTRGRSVVTVRVTGASLPRGVMVQRFYTRDDSDWWAEAAGWLAGVMGIHHPEGT